MKDYLNYIILCLNHTYELYHGYGDVLKLKSILQYNSVLYLHQIQHRFSSIVRNKSLQLHTGREGGGERKALKLR
jgi:hypothetical protein